MVGIARQRMHVRDLNHGQQRQQGQTHESSCSESVWLPAATLAEIRLQPCQLTILKSKDTQMRRGSGGQGFCFCSAIAALCLPTRARSVYTASIKWRADTRLPATVCATSPSSVAAKLGTFHPYA